MRHLLVYGFIGLFGVILVPNLVPSLIPTGWAAGSDSNDATPGLRDNVNYSTAKKAIATQDYQQAIIFLKKAAEDFPDNADIFNLLGYSSRKMNNFELGLQYYQRALQIEPEHRGANEYLGELYLETGKLAKAKERLQILREACTFGCDEYDELHEAIEAYKKKHGLK